MRALIRLLFGWLSPDKRSKEPVSSDPKPEKRPLCADDYLDLWKYFQGRADDLKAHMFESVTWIIGFAAAVLGFTFEKFADLSGDALTLEQKWLAVGFCGVGLLLCGYAGLVLAEHARHIQRNWARSKKCMEHLIGLPEVIKGDPPIGDTFGSKKLDVWWQVGIVVILFALGFVATLIFILTRCDC